MTAETFTKYMNHVIGRIADRVHSPNEDQRMGVIVG
jgi:hypothetical protein